MAYILGFSNKPFKDGGPPTPPQPPPPRHPNAFKHMVSAHCIVTRDVLLMIRRSPRLVVSSSGLLVMVAAADSLVQARHV